MSVNQSNNGLTIEKYKSTWEVGIWSKMFYTGANARKTHT